MSDETTTEQLAEIEGQAEAQPETQPQPIQVREGRWRTRGGDIRSVTPTPAHDSRAKRWPWRDAAYDQTWTPNGQNQFNCEESPSDLVEYLGPIEPDKTQELPKYTPPEGWREVRFGEQLLPGDVWVNHDGTEHRSNILQWDASAVSGGRCIRRIKPEAQPEPEKIEELRSEVAYVQRLLGESRQRVTQLEELVASLRTINRGCENAVREAGNMNTALRNQLAAVKAELVTQAETSRRLQIELDAAQQVPADSPELRQLRADLAEVTQDRDTYRDGYERVLSDLETIRETTKAETVEAILEWLEPVRATIEAADNVQQTMRADNLACDIIRNLPGILRYVVGLNHPEEIE